MFSLFSYITEVVRQDVVAANRPLQHYNTIAQFSASHQNKTPQHFPHIPRRFQKITDGASSIYHLPYADPLPSAFSANISSFRHIHDLQLMYLYK